MTLGRTYNMLAADLRVVLLVSAVLGLSVLPNVLGATRDSAPDFKGDLDPRIRLVTTGGFWERNSNSGRFRVVVFGFGRERLANAVYLQWIGYDRVRDIDVEVATIAIKEMNEEIGIVQNAKIVQDNVDGEAFVELVFGSDLSASTKTVRVVLGQPGFYSVKE